MEKIKCDLTNCFGIQNFQYEFDFKEDSFLLKHLCDNIKTGYKVKIFLMAAEDQWIEKR